MIIDPQDIALIREELNTTLTSLCQIEREDRAFGEFNELLHTWEVVANDVPCRVILLGERQEGAASIGEREAMVREYRLILPFGTELAANYRVILAGEKIYHVTAVRDQLTDAVDVQATIKEEGD